MSIQSFTINCHLGHYTVDAFSRQEAYELALTDERTKCLFGFCYIGKGE